MIENKSRFDHHELTTKGFNHTPNGSIFTNDIKSVYSLFLICMDLKEEIHGSKGFFNSFTKTYPFAFSLEDSIKQMKDLTIISDMNTTHINVSYHMSENLAHHWINVFMSAKLLHCPADRTRSEPKEKVMIQPTPKGVAILQKYSKDIGLKRLPKILISSLNSMQLFIFERSSLSDSIIHSDYLIHILFIKLMGNRPNIWSPSNPSDKLLSLHQLLEYTNDTFTFENTEFPFFESSKSDQKDEKPTSGSWSDQIEPEKLMDENRQSPFAHKFFTNPDSDSHIQYYVSNVGARLFKSKVFGNNKVEIEYSITSKSVWQWLMDCTDIIYPHEAISVAALFLKMGLIVPIMLPPSENIRKKFNISRTSYYTLSKLGSEIVQWNMHNSNMTESGLNVLKIETPKETCIATGFTVSGNIVIPDERRSLPNIFDDSNDINLPSNFSDLDDILRDPGMRYIFRLHLEKEFCTENLDSYIEIKKFLKKMTILKRILESKNEKDGRTKNKIFASKNDVTSTIYSALVKQANECLEMAYRIYSTYIMRGAPYQLNIDHELRESISNVMLNPKSPLYGTFPINFKTKKSASNGHLVSLAEDVPLKSSSKQQSGLSEAMAFNLGQSHRMPRRDFIPTPLNISENTNLVNTDDLKLSTNEEDNMALIECSMESHSDDLSSTIKVLKRVYPLYEEVSVKMYRLMKIDSLQKFQVSGIYRETLTLIGKESKDL